MQATALVNELYLKLFGGEPVDWPNRAHFFAVAAQQMRRLLVDHARAGLAEKRGGSRVKLSLTEVKGLAAPTNGHYWIWTTPCAAWKRSISAPPASSNCAILAAPQNRRPPRQCVYR